MGIRSNPEQMATMVLALGQPWERWLDQRISNTLAKLKQEEMTQIDTPPIKAYLRARAELLFKFKLGKCLRGWTSRVDDKGKRVPEVMRCICGQ